MTLSRYFLLLVGAICSTSWASKFQLLRTSFQLQWVFKGINCYRPQFTQQEIERKRKYRKQDRIEPVACYVSNSIIQEKDQRLTFPNKPTETGRFNLEALWVRYPNSLAEGVLVCLDNECKEPVAYFKRNKDWPIDKVQGGVLPLNLQRPISHFVVIQPRFPQLANLKDTQSTTESQMPIFADRLQPVEGSDGNEVMWETLPVLKTIPVVTPVIAPDDMDLTYFVSQDEAQDQEARKRELVKNRVMRYKARKVVDHYIIEMTKLKRKVLKEEPTAQDIENWEHYALKGRMAMKSAKRELLFLKASSSTVNHSQQSTTRRNSRAHTRIQAGLESTANNMQRTYDDTFERMLPGPQQDPNMQENQQHNLMNVLMSGRHIFRGQHPPPEDGFQQLPSNMDIEDQDDYITRYLNGEFNKDDQVNGGGTTKKVKPNEKVPDQAISDESRMEDVSPPRNPLNFDTMSDTDSVLNRFDMSPSKQALVENMPIEEINDKPANQNEDVMQIDSEDDNLFRDYRT